MIKKLYNKIYYYFYPKPIKKSKLEKMAISISKFQEGIDGIHDLLDEIFSSWAKTYVVEIKSGRRTYKFDLSNPSTKQEFERKETHKRKLIALLLHRCLRKKASVPCLIEDDTSFDEIIRYMYSPDPKDYEMNINKDSKVSIVEISQEQKDAWARLRAIYFPKKESNEVSK